MACHPDIVVFFYEIQYPAFISRECNNLPTKPYLHSNLVQVSKVQRSQVENIKAIISTSLCHRAIISGNQGAHAQGMKQQVRFKTGHLPRPSSAQ